MLQGSDSLEEEYLPSPSTSSKSPNKSSLPRPHQKMTVNSSQSGPTEDLISTATTALRRLHFKTGRLTSAKAAAAMAVASKITTKQQDQVVPKVVVMGSSTTSTETNINTSTDSSNTIITTMTATDGEGDSLDLMDTPQNASDITSEQIDTNVSESILTTDNTNIESLVVPMTPLITPITAIEKPPKSPKFHAEMFNYEEGHIAKYHLTPPPPPLPDLRVDFFAEPEPTSNVCLKQCLRDVGASLETVSPINVTTNPIDEVYNRKATIVVQQPTHSNAEHLGVSTFVLQNGQEFIDNSIPTPKHHLLDVGSHLTQQEMHDFEMRYGSPHHSRSQSVKTPGRAGGGRPNYLCLPQQRSRVASMPNTGVEEEYYRLRHFSITGKGVVNRGDSLKSRRSRSNTSVASSNSSTEHIASVAAQTIVNLAGRTSAPCSLASSRESSTSNPGPLPYKVLMLGGQAVGKSSLVSQFMTSEYLHAYDTSLDDDSAEKSVSVLLAGEESELIFIDHTYTEMTPEDCLQKYSDVQAYCVVYSSSDNSTFTVAETILQNLWTMDSVSTKAVILVANKADLVRSRVITLEEGKSLATSYDCKYIETSVGINHNVDELLVGLLTQIRLKLENPERTRDIFKKRSHSRKNITRTSRSGQATPTNVGSPHGTPIKKCRGSRTSASLKVRGLLEKVWSRDSKSKSCENLHVL